MTPDVEQIRAALAANAEGDCAQAETAYNTLVANAPVWLASLVSEVERLRALLDFPEVDTRRLIGERDHERKDADNLAQRLVARTSELDSLREQLDAALAKLDGYRSDHAALMGERNAALAECERLRSVFAVINEWPVAKERDAWRACADQLAPYALRHSRYDSTGPVNEALAVYETLKATS